MSWTTVAISLTVLAGCVVMPMNRTYYEPNPADGIPIRSASCGWNATALDAIKRDVGGITLLVFPRYEAGRPLRIYVLLGRTSMTAEVDPQMLELRFGEDSAVARPITTSVKQAGHYFFRSIDYEFSSSPDANEIAVTFLPGFIKLDGRDNKAMQFRFQRVTKSDIYYGSINC